MHKGNGRWPISGRDFGRWRDSNAQGKWPMADIGSGSLADGAILMHKEMPMADIADSFIGSGLGLLIA